MWLSITNVIVVLAYVLGIVALVAASVWTYLVPLRALRLQFTRDIWKSEDISDTKQKLWETRLKIVASLGVIVGAWWAVHSYNATAERELRKTFWDKQVQLYFEATQATSEIATLAADDSHRKEAITKFWQLYFGPLRVVEDDENVGNAMASFGRCLTEPGNASPMLECSQDDLLQRSLRLAIACRRSIAANWNRKLEGLNRL